MSAPAGGRRTKYFYSKIDGTVKVRGNTVLVHELLTIEGDIDYALGNVDVGKDVYITGSVRSGFTIRAKGSIAIGGEVEPGGAINAQGDVIVAGGIVGDHTSVVALGNLQAKFVHNSSVMARGDIVVGSYLLNAKIRAGGKLIVHSGDASRGGSIVGGDAFAAAGIRAARCGSVSTGHTVLGIGPAPDLAAKMRKLESSIRFCQTNILRAFRTLSLHEINAAQFKAMIARTAPSKRKQIMQVLRQLKGLTATKEKSVRLRRQLDDQAARSIRQAEIRSLDTAFSDTEIHMGDEKLALCEDVVGRTFFLTDSGIEQRPLS